MVTFHYNLSLFKGCEWEGTCECLSFWVFDVYSLGMKPPFLHKIFFKNFGVKIKHITWAHHATDGDLWKCKLDVMLVVLKVIQYPTMKQHVPSPGDQRKFPNFLGSVGYGLDSVQ